jgi:hypothetical protein
MNIEQLLGDEADSLLNHTAKAFGAEHLNLPGPDHLDEVFIDSDRSATVLRNLGTVYNTGRLAGTGYLSSIRGSSIRLQPASPNSRPTSTRPSSAIWPLPAIATPSPPPSAASASSPVGTCTRSRSS